MPIVLVVEVEELCSIIFLGLDILVAIVDDREKKLVKELACFYLKFTRLIVFSSFS